MKTFLSNVAKKIIKDEFYGPDSVIVLPNRRAEVFLKRELKGINAENIWLPEFFPVDQLIQRISGIRQADNISLSLQLYKVYKKFEGEEARELEEFLTWTPVIFNDFNDIDNAMADHEIIYKDLSAVKELEHWDPSRKPLSELQLNYLRFFRSMNDYYIGLREFMLDKRSGYSGFINRFLANNIDGIDIQWKRFLVAGVNAFTEAEMQIFDHLNTNYEVEFLWDVDEYYYDHTPGEVKNEAGKYIRKIIQRLKLNPPVPMGKNLKEGSKEVNIIGVPKNIGQVKFIGQKLLENNSTQNTAIVLGDESLLVPLLNSLPENEGLKYNITLGYPLANSSADHFFAICVDLVDSLLKNNGRIDTTYVINYLISPIAKVLTDIRVSNDIINGLAQRGKKSISKMELQDLFENEYSFNQLLISKLFSIKKGNHLQSFLDVLVTELLNSIKEICSNNKLIVEEIKAIINITSKIKTYVEEFGKELDTKSLKKVGKQLFMQDNIDLIGEPLEGIQIMGMLETRTLDFENIYILSANEGILPKTNSIDSFIPFDIRKENGLPLPSYKTGIYAYHFFRLIQRCSELTVLYGTNSDKIGGGEKSRFILQMENELFPVNQKISHNDKILTTDLDINIKSDDDIIIFKDDLIQKEINDLDKRGYSASVLTSYIACPLKFYFQRILGVNPDQSQNQDIAANTFGNVIHKVLEKIYEPFITKSIDIKSLNLTKETVDKLLIEVFDEYGKGEILDSGKNLLLFEVARSHITRFLNWDIKNLKKNPAQLIGVENKLITTLPGNDKIVLKGTIDRIDRIQSTGKVRIIDYKTGFVKPTTLNLRNPEKLYYDPEYDKAFQLLYYSWLFSLTEKNFDIQSGIVSTRNISNGFMELTFQNLSSIGEYYEEFSDNVYGIIDDIRNPDLEIRPTSDSKRCKYCNYRSICNR